MPIWFAVDKSTDIKNRYVANIILGPLNALEFEPSYLISSKFLPKTNSDTIFTAAAESLNSLFHGNNDQVKDNVVLFLSDSASYMLKAGRNFKEYFKNRLHLTCLAHALYNICEFIRDYYKTVDCFISEAKKFF